MSTYPEYREDTATTRAETLLHQAADFVPAETAPEGLATRALARWESAGRECSPRLKRNFAPALGMALAGAALIALLSRPGDDRLPLPTKPTFPQIAVAVSPEAQGSQPSVIVQYTKFPPSVELPSLPSESKPIRLAHHRHTSRRAFPKTPPKAIWTVETVQTEQVGALYAAWTMPEDESPETSPDNDSIIMQPVVLSVPLQSQVTSCAAPSASPFPLPPPAPIPAVPQEAEPNPSDSNTSNSHEEPKQP